MLKRFEGVSFLMVQIVKPALLAFAGPITPLALAQPYVALAATERNAGGLILIASTLYVGGLLLLGSAFALLIDRRNRKIWGSVVAGLNGITGFLTLAWLSGAILYFQPSSFLLLHGAAYLAGPSLGFLGGVLCTLRKA